MADPLSIFLDRTKEITIADFRKPIKIDGYLYYTDGSHCVRVKSRGNTKSLPVNQKHLEIFNQPKMQFVHSSFSVWRKWPKSWEIIKSDPETCVVCRDTKTIDYRQCGNCGRACKCCDQWIDPFYCKLSDCKGGVVPGLIHCQNCSNSPPFPRRYYFFGCVIAAETVHKLNTLDDVEFVYPKDYQQPVPFRFRDQSGEMAEGLFMLCEPSEEVQS